MVGRDHKNYLIYKFCFLNFVLLGRFMVSDFLAFFIFFEISLIPTLVIILGWGVQPERIRAGGYLMIYTIIGALPLLASLI